MLNYGLFHIMDSERKNAPAVVVTTDDHGTVTGFQGPDWYRVLAQAVDGRWNVSDVIDGYPGQFYFHLLDSTRADGAPSNFLDIPSVEEADDPKPPGGDVRPYLISAEQVPVAVVFARSVDAPSVSMTKVTNAPNDEFELLAFWDPEYQREALDRTTSRLTVRQFASSLGGLGRGFYRELRADELTAYLGTRVGAAKLVSPALAQLVDVMARDGGEIAREANWVAFLSADAYIEAEMKLGLTDVISVNAYLLTTDGSIPAERDVREWVVMQPTPLLGVLSVGQRDVADGTEESLPLLTFDVLVSAVADGFIDDLLFPLAEAWDSRSVLQFLEDDPLRAVVSRYKPAPVVLSPENAWLLIGDSASYPTPEVLAEMWDEGMAGIFDTEWTAPKNGELGDLVLFYFIAPQKAACFVARLASRPHWRTDTDVNSVAEVGTHQWWAYTTPLIEIEAISYVALREAQNGYLNLRGRSGHYLSAKSIAALTFTAVRPEQQLELDRVAQVPKTMDALPDFAAVNFDIWREIPSGLLALEAKVSEFIVTPLVSLLLRAPRAAAAQLMLPTLGPIEKPEYPVPSGYVDFVFMYGGPPIPALAVEVKLSILRPSSGIWFESPDFQQLLRYMNDLDTPGLLVDAHSLLLVKRGAVTPFAEIVRSHATWDDIALIRDLLLDYWETKQPPQAAVER